MGRHPYQPEAKDRRKVKRLAALKVPPTEIAERTINRQTGKPIDIGTLREFYAEELKAGHLDLYITTADLYVRRVTGAPAEFDAEGNQIRAEVLPSEQAQEKFLKTFGAQYGWDGQRRDLLDDVDETKLTDVELATLKAILAKGAITPRKD